MTSIQAEKKMSKVGMNANQIRNAEADARREEEKAMVAEYPTRTGMSDAAMSRFAKYYDAAIETSIASYLRYDAKVDLTKKQAALLDG